MAGNAVRVAWERKRHFRRRSFLSSLERTVIGTTLGKAGLFPVSSSIMCLGLPLFLRLHCVVYLLSHLTGYPGFDVFFVFQVFLLEGSCVSYADLENAGIRTAKTVLVMKDPR